MRWTWPADRSRSPLTAWHVWFAWYPVRLQGGNNQWIWLDYVLRRVEWFMGYRFGIYKPIDFDSSGVWYNLGEAKHPMTRPYVAIFVAIGLMAIVVGSMAVGCIVQLVQP